jgi:acetate kinase
MEKSELLKFLQGQVEVFQCAAPPDLEALLEAGRMTTFEAGEAVLEFSEEGRYLGVIIEGQVEVSVTDDSGDTHRLETLNPGNLFGVPSLLTGRPNMADVIGLTPGRALLIPQAAARAHIMTTPESIPCLSRILADRVQKLAVSNLGVSVKRADPRRDDPYGFKLRSEEPLTLLVINCGSSSIKYNLFNTADESRNLKGGVERIGREGTLHTYQTPAGPQKDILPLGTHEQALEVVVKTLVGPAGPLASANEVAAVGHRVVHGGERFHDAVVIDGEVISAIEACSALAPLHNPVNLDGIRAAQKLFPQAAQVAVFDTAFHQTLPAYAYLYGLPWEYYTEKGIRRYGFHGTNHKYVSLKTAEYLNRPYNELETIVCHLGNGASICAVDHGRSVDTSMGYTPAEGLLMGTRCGDLDVGIVQHLMRTEGLTEAGLNSLINDQGGLAGLSGVSNDLREIQAAAEQGNHRALLTLKVFAYRVRKYIGAYLAAMGGLDALVFTGGIGQGSVDVRSLACQGLGQMGIVLDEDKNRTADGFKGICDITGSDSKVRVLVIPADEERMIARETLRSLERNQVTKIIGGLAPTPVPIEISAHHVHLSQEHVEALFGQGYQLTAAKDLSQPGQFASEEMVNLIGPKGQVNKVRILGPVRRETQIEISMTEQYALGIHPPIRESGSLAGTPGCTLEGPMGRIKVNHGVICALRHIHMSAEDALRMGFQDKDMVRVKVPGDRELIFGDVLVRVSPNYRLAMHLDTDEGNAANLTTGVVGYIESIQSRQ